MKFHENRSKSSGDMERTPNSRENPMTLTCDFNIESKKLGYVFCTPAY